MSNSQNLQELKNATMSNNHNLQEFKQFTYQAIAKREGQIGQLANQVGEREKGKFPSHSVPNPKDNLLSGVHPTLLMDMSMCKPSQL
jgi:hypothetical protein